MAGTKKETAKHWNALRLRKFHSLSKENYEEYKPEEKKEIHIEPLKAEETLESYKREKSNNIKKDEETGMKEPKYLLFQKEIWSADPGKLEWVAEKTDVETEVGVSWVEQGKQVLRGIPGSGGE